MHAYRALYNEVDERANSLVSRYVALTSSSRCHDLFYIALLLELPAEELGIVSR